MEKTSVSEFIDELLSLNPADFNGDSTVLLIQQIVKNRSEYYKAKEREQIIAAYKAGEEVEGYDWHMQEFHVGDSCRCVKPQYSNINEYITETYQQ